MSAKETAGAALLPHSHVWVAPANERLDTMLMRRKAAFPTRLAQAARAGLALLCAVALAVPQAKAQGQGAERSVPLIRDSEIEALMRDYATPVLRAAGLQRQNIQVVIINDRSFNAFVADGRRIFINVGALVMAEAPGEIIGVLAHEAGHIAGGHLARLREQLESAQTMAIIAMLLSVGAIAGAAAGGGRGSEVGNVGAAAVTAPQMAIMRTLLAYQRSEESAADRAAIRYLDATGQSARGMLRTFQRLADQQLLLSRTADPYMQSHPMAAERITALEQAARASPHFNTPENPALQARHDMMRAKIIGYMDPFDTVLRRYPASNTSLPARYARAIAATRFSDIRAAQAQVDALIESQPNNPYFWELKGQSLLQNGRAREAIAPLRRAVALAPNAPLIRMRLGQALVASGDQALSAEAVSTLRNALAREPDASPDVYRQLAIAHGRAGNLAEAELASAQAAFMSGDFPTAKQLAGRAKGRFPIGSPGYVRADDIVNFQPPRSR
jgi:predicted Zn-dependent protease